MARGKQFGRTIQSSRRKSRLTQWDLGPGGDDLATLDVIAISSTTKVILGSGRTALDALTIVRTHGMLEMQLASISAAQDGFSWAAGICVVSTDAFIAGAASIPNPFDDLDWSGWMWHQMGAVHSPTATIADMGSDILKVVMIDSKSQRIQKPNETVAFIFQAGETGTAVLHVRAATRQLLKLG